MDRGGFRPAGKTMPYRWKAQMSWWVRASDVLAPTGDTTPVLLAITEPGRGNPAPVG